MQCKGWGSDDQWLLKGRIRDRCSSLNTSAQESFDRPTAITCKNPFSHDVPALPPTMALWRLEKLPLEEPRSGRSDCLRNRCKAIYRPSRARAAMKRNRRKRTAAIGDHGANGPAHACALLRPSDGPKPHRVLLLRQIKLGSQLLGPRALPYPLRGLQLRQFEPLPLALPRTQPLLQDTVAIGKETQSPSPPPPWTPWTPREPARPQQAQGRQTGAAADRSSTPCS